MDINREVKEKVYKFKGEIEEEINENKRKGMTINEFTIKTKIENQFKKIYLNAILHKYTGRLKNLEHMFYVNVTSCGNNIEVKIGNSIFFEDLEIKIDKFNIKIIRNKVNYYTIFHDESKWKNINDDTKIKMVELYDSLISEKIGDISLEKLEKGAKFNIPLESVVMEYKIDFVVKQLKSSSKTEEVKKFLRTNYNYWKDKYNDTREYNNRIETCEIFKAFCDEGINNVEYVHIFNLSKNIDKVERLISQEYKLYIGKIGYASGKYKPMLTKLALSRGMNSEYFSGFDGILKNSSNRNVLFLGNEQGGIHGQFEGVIKPGDTTPQGIDVDFIYWEKHFYKVFPNIIGSFLSLSNKIIMLGKIVGLNVDNIRVLDKPIVPITQITDIGVWLSNFLRLDFDIAPKDKSLLQIIKDIVRVALPLQNQRVIDNDLVNRKLNYEAEYKVNFD